MLSYEEIRKTLDEVDDKFKERDKQRAKARREELEAKGIRRVDDSQIPKKHCDHPNTIENSTATFFWVVAMVISLLFHGGWMLCILEMVVWLKFITRHNEK